MAQARMRELMTDYKKGDFRIANRIHPKQSSKVTNQGAIGEH
jgi:hypothetical protein